MDDLRWATQLTLPGDKSAFDKLTPSYQIYPSFLIRKLDAALLGFISSAMAIAIRNKSHP